MGTSYLRYPTPGGGAGGDVVGPASSTDSAVALFDGTTGKLLKNSVITISEAGALDLPHVTTPSTPAVGHNKFYAKATSKGLFNLNSDGTELLLVGTYRNFVTYSMEIPRYDATDGSAIQGGSLVAITPGGGYSDMHYVGDGANYLEFYPAGDGIGFGKNVYGSASFHLGKAATSTATWASGNIGSWFIGTTAGTYKTPVSLLEVYQQTTATASRISLTSLDLGRTSSDGSYLGLDTSGNLEVINQESGLKVVLGATAAGIEIATGGSKPAANSSTRGQLFLERGGAGVADVLYMCMKDAADAYDWEIIHSA